MICPKCFNEHDCTVCPRCGGFMSAPRLEITMPNGAEVQLLKPQSTDCTVQVVHEFEIPDKCDDCPFQPHDSDGTPIGCIFDWDSYEESWRNLKPMSKCPGPGKYKIVRS